MTGTLTRALDDVLLEGRLGDVGRHAPTVALHLGDDGLAAAAGDERTEQVVVLDPGERGVARVDRDRVATRRARVTTHLAPTRMRAAPRSRRLRGVRSDGARCPRARAAPRAGRSGRCESDPMDRAGSRDGGSARRAGTRRRGRPPSSGTRRSSSPTRRGDPAPRRRRALRGRPSCARRGSLRSQAARSGGTRARRGTPRSPSAARPREHGAGAHARRHTGRSPRASRAGRRGRSGGRARREMPRARSSSTSARYARHRLLAEAGEATAGIRDVQQHERRLPPRRPPRLRRTPRRARGSGTRRLPCSRPTASRGRPARTRCARAPASGAPPRRALSPATPRSRRLPPAPEAHAGTCGCER